jgi:hypothetical protein
MVVMFVLLFNSQDAGFGASAVSVICIVAPQQNQIRKRWIIMR